MTSLSCEAFLVVDRIESNCVCEVGPIVVILVGGKGGGGKKN